jgi:anaerobic magnesium-protoporphyrin IX monomethyl ester cyclase
MRIVLIRPLYRTASFDPEVQESLGLGMIGAVARQNGHAVLLLDAMLSPQSEETTARRAAAFRPDVVGFTTMSSGDLQSIVTLMGHLAALCSVVPRFVVGGPLVTIAPEQTMRALPRDVLGVRFEGEMILPSLLARWQRNEPVRDLDGITYCDAGGTVVTNPPGLPVSDLDDLPFAARDLAPTLRASGIGINLQGSRGCAGSCAYCSAPFFRRPGFPPWRGKSPRRITDELSEMVRAHDIRVFNFVDDDFLGPADLAVRRVAELCEDIEQRDLRIAFSIQARPESLTPELVGKLARAGLVHVFLGLETDDEEVLRRWGRRQDTDTAWRTVEAIRRSNVELQAGAILFHPTATLASVGRMAERLCEQALLNYRTSTNRLRLLPGSRLYSQLAGANSTKAPGGALDAPIVDERVARLLFRLDHALEPLRSPWVFVVSRLPDLLGQERVQATRPASRALEVVRAVGRALDQATTRTFFALHRGATLEQPGADADLRSLRSANLGAASAAVATLLDAHIIDPPLAATLRPVALADDSPCGPQP